MTLIAQYQIIRLFEEPARLSKSHTHKTEGKGQRNRTPASYNVRHCGVVLASTPPASSQCFAFARSVAKCPDLRSSD